MASLNGKCQFVAARYSVWETFCEKGLRFRLVPMLGDMSSPGWVSCPESRWEMACVLTCFPSEATAQVLLRDTFFVLVPSPWSLTVE